MIGQIQRWPGSIQSQRKSMLWNVTYFVFVDAGTSENQPTTHCEQKTHTQNTIFWTRLLYVKIPRDIAFAFSKIT
jgi:hypothetical protein